MLFGWFNIPFFCSLTRGIGRNGWMVDGRLCAFVTLHGILIQNGHKQDLGTKGVFERCEFFLLNNIPFSIFYKVITVSIGNP